MMYSRLPRSAEVLTSNQPEEIVANWGSRLYTSPAQKNYVRLNIILSFVGFLNNTVAAPLSGVRPGICVDAGNALSVNDAVCLNISGNTSAGSGGSDGIGLRKQGTVMTTNAFGLQGIPQTTPTNTDVANYVNAQNPAGGGTLIISGSNFAQCTSAPAIAPPVDTESEPKQQAANLTQSGTSVGLLARLQHTLRPVFTAFHTSLSYISLARAFSQVAETVAPPAMAAELDTTSQTTTPHKPAKTLLINSKGEYSIVPTTAIPATFAGETITINGTGNGDLPVTAARGR
jgi:hypothetical protein